jgi:hypothetical protein
LDEGVVGGCTT